MTRPLLEVADVICALVLDVGDRDVPAVLLDYQVGADADTVERFVRVEDSGSVGQYR